MDIPDHISDSLETLFWAKNAEFFAADPDSGSGIFFIRDPRWKTSDPGPV
jgi:hypothetical protein